MQYTTNYNLNLVEGTDIVNPLVQQNPNYSTIDAAMFANKQASIGTGTELTAGTVHTITRLNPDSNYVRFTATSNWTAGDTMVVDSTPVSVYLSDGTTPATGAYVINTEVLILVNGSRVTILTSGAVISTAAQISYDNTQSGLSATDVQNAIDEVNEKIDGKVLASVTADGVKTYSDILNELYADLDTDDLTNNATLTFGASSSFNVARIVVKEASNVSFAVDYIQRSGSGIIYERYILDTSESKALEGLIMSGSVTFLDRSSSTPANGTVFKIYA